MIRNNCSSQYHVLSRPYNPIQVQLAPTWDQDRVKEQQMVSTRHMASEKMKEAEQIAMFQT